MFPDIDSAILSCHADSFWTNPQYRVNIEGLDEDCAEEEQDHNMLVSLMQKPDKRNRRLVKSLHIGFSIYKVCVRFLSLIMVDKGTHSHYRGSSCQI